MTKTRQGRGRPKAPAEALTEQTQLVHDERYSKGAVSPPIYQSSLFTFESYAALLQRYRGESDQPVYSRVSNPTLDVLCGKLAQLERGGDAAVFSSGMAAISNAILSVVRAGERIVCVENVYPDTYRFLRSFCSRLGIGTDFVDGTDLDAVAASLPGAALLYLESPTTWLMQELDLRAIAKLARAAKVKSIVDNTWASPLFQKPLTLGIDTVVHSASKYLCGHSDVVAGAVIGSVETIGNIERNVSLYLGGKLSAHEAALIIRGLRTLPLRMARHQDSGLQIAQRLALRKEVTKVHHPAIQDRSFRQLAGYGGLFSIELAPTVDIGAFCDALQLFRIGVSWGGHESLVMPAAASLQQPGEHNAARDFEVSPRLVRLFVGLEDPEDLWRDLAAAFERSRVRPGARRSA